MLRVALVFLFCLLSVAWNDAATARPGFGGSSSSVGGCLAGIDNGCAGSLGGSVQVSNMLTGYTGTSYPIAGAAINWCGITYVCGAPSVATGSVCAPTQDPATATRSLTTDQPACGIIPEHCPYNPVTVSGQVSGGDFDCTSAVGAVFHGFEMAATGGHGSTYINGGVDTGSDVYVEDNDFAADAFTYYKNGPASWTNGTTANIHWLRNTINGHWLDSFSAQGSATCTQSGTTISCPTSNNGQFAAGQYIGTAGTCGTAGQTACNTAIQSVSGTNYTVNTSTTISTPIAMTSQFQWAGGIGCNSTGAHDAEYNAVSQVNGRMFTCSVAVGASPNPFIPGDVTQKYNFYNNACIFTFGIAHWEAVENVLAASPPSSVQWNNGTYVGNTYYQGSSCASNSTTAAIFISTGFVNGTIPGTFVNSYVNEDIEGNLFIGLNGPNTSAALVTWGGSPISHLTLKNNYSTKSPANYYVLSNGSPSPVGSPNATSGVIAYIHATHDAVAHTLTLQAYDGGYPIATDGSFYTDFAGCAQITGLVSGTPNSAGAVYSTVGGVTVSTSTNTRAAQEAILNAPMVSGNVDVNSGSNIDSVFISRNTGGLNPSVYPGCS